MNAQADLAEPIEKFVDFNTLLGDPTNPCSHWNELRCAELSGCDYLFISRELSTKLTDRATLKEFIIEIYDLLNTGPERSRFFIYSENELGRFEFNALHFSWRDGQFREFNISAIKNIDQKDFVRTIFDHSAYLLGPTPAIHF